jgi:hypothetical protein
MKYLTTDSELMCCHGGTLELASRARSKVRDAALLTETDLYDSKIKGCPQVGLGIKPCTRVTGIMLGKSIKVLCRTTSSVPLLENLIAVTDGSPMGTVTMVDDGGSTAETLQSLPPNPSDPPEPSLDDPRPGQLCIELRLDLANLHADQDALQLFFGPRLDQHHPIVVSVFQKYKHLRREHLKSEARKQDKCFRRECVWRPADPEIKLAFPLCFNVQAEYWVHIAPAGQAPAIFELEPDYRPRQMLLAPKYERLEGSAREPQQLFFHHSPHLARKVAEVVKAAGIERAALLQLHGFSASQFPDEKCWHVFRFPRLRQPGSSNSIVLMPRYPELVKLKAIQRQLEATSAAASRHLQHVLNSPALELAQWCVEADKEHSGHVDFKWAWLNISKFEYQRMVGFEPCFNTPDKTTIEYDEVPVTNEIRFVYQVLLDAVEARIRRATIPVIKLLNDLVNAVNMPQLEGEFKSVTAVTSRSLRLLDVPATYQHVDEKYITQDPLAKAMVSHSPGQVLADMLGLLTDLYTWLNELRPMVKGSPAFLAGEQRWNKLHEDLLALDNQEIDGEYACNRLLLDAGKTRSLDNIWPPRSWKEVLVKHVQEASNWREIVDRLRKLELEGKFKFLSSAPPKKLFTRNEIRRLRYAVDRTALYLAESLKKLKPIHNSALGKSAWFRQAPKVDTKSLQELESWQRVGVLRVVVATWLVVDFAMASEQKSALETWKQWNYGASGVLELTELGGTLTARHVLRNRKLIGASARVAAGATTLALRSKVLLGKLGPLGVALDGGLGVYEISRGNEVRGAWLIGSGALAAFALIPGIGWVAGTVLIVGSIACAVVADYHRTTPFQTRLAEILNRTQFAKTHFEKIVKPAIGLESHVTDQVMTRLLEYVGGASMTYADEEIGSISSVRDALEDIFREIRKEFWTLDAAWFPVEYPDCPPPTDHFEISPLNTEVCLANPTPQELCKGGAPQKLIFHRALRIGYRLPTTGLAEEHVSFSLPEQFGLSSLRITLNCCVDDTKRCSCAVEIEAEGPKVAPPKQASPATAGMKSLPDNAVGEINDVRALVMVIRPLVLASTTHYGNLEGKAGEMLHLIVVCVNPASPHETYQLRFPEIPKVRATVIGSAHPEFELHLSRDASQHSTPASVKRFDDPYFLGKIDWPEQ